MAACLAVSLLAACGEDARPEDAGMAPDRPDAARDAAGEPDDASDAGADADAGDAGDETELIPLPERSPDAHCKLEGTRSEDLPRVALEPVELEDELRFEDAVSLALRSDEPDVVYVVEQTGVVHRVDRSSTPATASVLLDLSGAIACCGHSGLRAVAFHPAFADNGMLFVHYVTGSPSRSVIARIEVDLATGEALPNSTRVVLEVTHPGDRRAGGPLLFDGDGMLLVALGDGGADPLSLAPRDPMLGAVLRIDVSVAPDDASYSVPPDNPFVGDEDAKVAPEVWAYGFADPAACAIDPADGALYCVDRGVGSSELNRVEAGRDYGWPEVDGSICVRTQEVCLGIGESALAGYLHLEQRCGVLGAPSLRAPEALEGSVLYADQCTGTIYGVGLRGENAGKRSALEREQAGIAAMTSDANGELLLITSEGVLERARLASGGTPGTFPERLSETGCFEGAMLRDPAPDLIPFDVSSPLWSDGTHKRRYVVIPQGARIEAPDEGPWTFPNGTMLVKEFALQRDDADPESVVPIETRFLLLRPSGWEFHSYRWNDEGTDAERVREEMDVDYEVMRRGESYTQTYQFPDKDTCPICHSSAPGQPLGIRTAQLNHELAYVGGGRNQLEVLAGLDLFERAPGSDHEGGVSDLPALPDYRSRAVPLEQRARSYLHTHCAHCHQPGGYSSPDLTMDLRYERTLLETGICDQPPVFFDKAERLIAPGDPESSAIWVRMRGEGIDRMPPVATLEIDSLGVVVMTRWIEELTRCPSQ